MAERSPKEAMIMKRTLLKSKKGKPMSVAEIATLRLAVMLVAFAAVTAYSGSAAGVVTAVAAFLVMDRVQILIDWAREVRETRRADARMLRALRRPYPPVPAGGHAAVRP